VAELLLANHADVNAKAHDGTTPLYWASSNGHKDVAELLLANHAEVDAKTDIGTTPLLLASLNGHKDVAELLLANHADVNAKAHDGTTPLYWASSNGHKDVAELLLANHAEVDAKTDIGTTPLYAASLNGHKDVAQLLLASKAKPVQLPESPVPIEKVEPEYSEEATKAHVEGIVLLTMVVDTTGQAREIRVLKSLGYGLDENAISAVEKWKFKPGMKDGHPVSVVAQIEVIFRLL
jgi:TonB family protein